MNRHDEENFEKVVQFFRNELGADHIEADRTHGFWLVDGDVNGSGIVVTSVGNGSHYQLFIERIGENSTGKEIGDGFEKVEKVISEIRHRVGDGYD